MKVDRKLFFERARASLFPRGLAQAQVEGIEALLDECERQGIGDARWIANVLAQCHHETGGRLEPVREGFADSDDAAIAHVGRLFRAGRIRTNYALPNPGTKLSYFGRGLIQLTHRTNYQALGVRLGLPLAEYPYLALDLPVSAAIAVVGMAEGLFASDDKGPHSLARYFSLDVDDPVGARRIVNGVDKAREIALLHGSYLAAVKAARMPEAPAPRPPSRPAVEMEARLAALEAEVAALRATVAGLAAAPRAD